MLTSIGNSSLAISMRDFVVETLLRSRNATLCLAGEHSRTGESSKCRAVSAKTAKMNIGHFRVERQKFIAIHCNLLTSLLTYFQGSRLADTVVMISGCGEDRYLQERGREDYIAATYPRRSRSDDTLKQNKSV